MWFLMAPWATFRRYLDRRAAERVQTAATVYSGIPNALMERSQARAGLNPQQARELRRAAQIYLSVVR